MAVQKAKVKTTPWEPWKHIEDDEYAALYLEVALEEGDAQDVATVLGHIARYKGMAQVARATGMGRESLYKALSANGNPELATILKVVKALGLQLHATVADAKAED